MPRTARSVLDGCCYHVLNRGNGRMTIFHKDGDYAAFLRVLGEGLSRCPSVQLHAYCLMPNHWHLVMRPGQGRELAKLMGWVGVTHVRRHHEHHHTRGGGHLYQGRFKSFPVEPGHHFLTVCRYVEANAARAGLCERAEDWRWCSLAARNASADAALPLQLTDWPDGRPEDWLQLVNARASEHELERLRTSVNRGRPFGTDAWTLTAAAEQGLKHTLTDGPGRPKKRRNE